MAVNEEDATGWKRGNGVRFVIVRTRPNEPAQALGGGPSASPAARSASSLMKGLRTGRRAYFDSLIIHSSLACARLFLPGVCAEAPRFQNRLAALNDRIDLGLHHRWEETHLVAD